MTSVHELLGLIKKKIVVIIVLAIVGAAVGGIYTYIFVPPTYTAYATMYVSNNNTAKEIINSTDITAAKSLVDTYSEILKSDATLSKVVEDLPQYNLSEEQIRRMLSTDALNQTEIFKVSISSSDQLMSRDICEDIVKVGQEQIIRVIQVGTVTVVDSVKVPTDKHWNLAKNILIALLLSVFLTILTIFIVDEFDMTVKTRNIIEKYFTIPVIGVIPNIDYVKKKCFKKQSRKEKSLKGRIVGKNNSRYLISLSNNYYLKEAYRETRTNISYLDKQKSSKIYVVSSAVPDECKTVSSINIALSLQSSGKKVVLLDFDLRKPRIKYDLGIECCYGVTDYLLKYTDKIPVIDYQDTGLAVMCSGDVSFDNVEIIDTLLDGDRISELLSHLSEQYEYIIIDTPPLNITSDALVFADMVDGYFLSVRAGYSNINQMKLLVKKIEAVNGKISGIVLNSVNPNYAMYGGYYSNYSNKTDSNNYYHERNTKF